MRSVHDYYYGGLLMPVLPGAPQIVNHPMACVWNLIGLVLIGCCKYSFETKVVYFADVPQDVSV